MHAPIRCPISWITTWAALYAFAALAAGDTLYVSTCGNDSWTGADPDCSAPDGPKRHIQAALDAADDGWEIVVAPGTYSDIIDFEGKAIFLHSADGPDATIIKPSRSNFSIISCISGEGPETILEGFTITAGKGLRVKNNVDGYDYLGGGMYIESSSPTVRNCVFTKNIVGNTSINGVARGAGVYNFAGSPLIDGCTFSENRLTPRPDFWATGAALYSENGDITIQDCVVTANRAEGDYGDGGGFCVFGGRPLVLRCNFGDNVAAYGFGGGILLATEGSATLSNCNFTSNNGGAGAALSMGGDDLVASACTFQGNYASRDGGGAGGAVHVTGTAAIFGCMFANNRAAGSGPGGGFGGAIWTRRSDLTLIYCRIEDNLADEFGGGIYAAGESSVNLHSCAFVGNGAGFSDGGAMFGGAELTVSSCVFLGNYTPSFGHGGAIANGGEASTTTILGCAFIANDSGHGGALNTGTSSSITIRSSIFWSNTSNEIEGDYAADLTFCNIAGGYEGEGNIDADPLFTRNPDPGDDGWWGTEDDDYGDLRLLADSPCIDAGDPNYVAAPGETDLDGLFRVWDGNADGPAIIDMGAYEFAARPYGDLNCDGAVDFNDIDPFVTALIGRGDYESIYPICQFLLADINADGSVDFDDIDGFVNCLVNGGCERQ